MLNATILERKDNIMYKYSGCSEYFSNNLAVTYIKYAKTTCGMIFVNFLF